MSNLRLLAAATAAALFVTSAIAAENGAIISSEEIERHVGFLASDALEGRGTATRGERKAGAYIAKQFASYGLKPGAADGTFFQSFNVAGSTKLGPRPTLKIQVGPWHREFEAKDDFNPFGFSSSFKGEVPLVFAGYGITNDETGYDDYAGLDVKGKAVLLLRHEPNEPRRMSRHATFNRKAANAKAHGAVALLIITDPRHHADDDDVLPFGPGADAGIFAAHVRQSLAIGLFSLGNKDLLQTQEAIDKSGKPQSFDIGAKLIANVTIEREEAVARNVVAMLPGTDPNLRGEVLVIGAHYDHLGLGNHGGSLAPGSRGEIHNGADDNASGTAGLLELAQAFAAAPARRTIYFVGFSGEERGLLGSQHFVQNPPIDIKTISAMVNLDMIGRLRGNSVEVGGAGTAPGFEAMILKATKAEGLETKLTPTGFGPSDHASFYRAKIPVLFFFTGLHSEYHRPTDDVHLLNAQGASKVARAAYACARELADADARPTYVSVTPARRTRRNGVRVGVMIDSGYEGKGIRIAEVVPGAPGAKAGLEDGDVLVTFDGQTLESIDDLRKVLAGKKPGDTVTVQLERGQGEITLQIKLGG